MLPGVTGPVGRTMRLELRVTNYRQLPAEISLLHSFDRTSGSIGRSQGNDLVLPDPSRYVSSHHATIEYRNGDYFNLDTSANGLSVNDPGRKLGQGNSVTLRHGDRLFIGDYEVAVSLLAEAQDQVSGSGIPDDWGAESQGRASVDPRPAPAPLASGEGAPGPTASQILAALDNDPRSSADVDMDPFSAPEGSPGVQPDDDFREQAAHSDPSLGIDEEPALPDADELPMGARGSHADHVPFTDAAMPPVHAIPDDWENEPDSGGRPRIEDASSSDIPTDWNATSVTPRSGQQPAAPAPKRVKRKPSREQEAAAPPPRSSRRGSAKPSPPPPGPSPAPVEGGPSDRAALDTLLRGAGLEDLDIPDTAVPVVLELAGQLLREALQGTMYALRARATIRQEMRMDMTALRPKENNPLKFTPTVDEALAHMLAPRAKGYLPPVQSVREAFEDLKIHQVATMAGMEAAMRYVLKRFNPASLQQRVQKHGVLDTMLPMNRKAKTWELFAELYAEIASEAEVDFNAVFGKAFMRAYDDYVRRVQAAAKKS